MSPPLTCADAIRAAIVLNGPIPVAHFMAAANRHFYATRDPLGRAGDFITAPEISQMFGELVGLWCADLWDRAGRPAVAWVELGPGRGTLAADALRAMATAGLTPDVHLVETSPVLRAAQAGRVPGATWHDDIATLPADCPLIVVANEFFDALPIRQLIRSGGGWRERFVGAAGPLFVPVPGGDPLDRIIPEPLSDAPPGSIIETSPASVAIARDIGRRLAAQGGVALVIDYGYSGPAIGDTLQAVSAHAFANPFDDPGERDLTAHVDFATLAAAAAAEGLAVFGPTGQGAFLRTLGIETRAAALDVNGGEAVRSAVRRLTDGAEMGDLFRVIAMTAPGWPVPAGFA